VRTAVNSQPFERVASTPPPDCILMELGDSTARYAVRYWLLDFAADDPTDSLVRTRVYFALNRAGIPLSMPAQAVFLTQDSLERRSHKNSADHLRRVEVLSRIDLFQGLSHEELTELAAALHRAPFAKGEVLTQEGAEAHHLYIIDKGEVSIRVRDGAASREVNRIGAGDFFGEMSLLTGARRSATVVALTDVECYRLDADAFRRLLERRTDLAETVAGKLAERRVGLTASRAPRDERKDLVESTGRDLLDKIRAFFQL
jgi:hypothetical protein